ncbi:hypothetical protein ScPMuIL_009311 [Solemya velum]
METKESETSQKHRRKRKSEVSNDICVIELDSSSEENLLHPCEKKKRKRHRHGNSQADAGCHNKMTKLDKTNKNEKVDDNKKRHKSTCKLHRDILFSLPQVDISVVQSAYTDTNSTCPRGTQEKKVVFSTDISVHPVQNEKHKSKKKCKKQDAIRGSINGVDCIQNSVSFSQHIENTDLSRNADGKNCSEMSEIVHKKHKKKNKKNHREDRDICDDVDASIQNSVSISHHIESTDLSCIADSKNCSEMYEKIHKKEKKKKKHRKEQDTCDGSIHDVDASIQNSVSISHHIESTDLSCKADSKNCSEMYEKIHKKEKKKKKHRKEQDTCDGSIHDVDASIQNSVSISHHIESTDLSCIADSKNCSEMYEKIHKKEKKKKKHRKEQDTCDGSIHDVDASIQNSVSISHHIESTDLSCIADKKNCSEIYEKIHTQKRKKKKRRKEQDTCDGSIHDVDASIQNSVSISHHIENTDLSCIADKKNCSEIYEKIHTQKRKKKKRRKELDMCDDSVNGVDCIQNSVSFSQHIERTDVSCIGDNINVSEMSGKVNKKKRKRTHSSDDDRKGVFHTQDCSQIEETQMYSNSERKKKKRKKLTETETLSLTHSEENGELQSVLPQQDFSQNRKKAIGQPTQLLGLLSQKLKKKNKEKKTKKIASSNKGENSTVSCPKNNSHNEVLVDNELKKQKRKKHKKILDPLSCRIDDEREKLDPNTTNNATHPCPQTEDKISDVKITNNVENGRGGILEKKKKESVNMSPTEPRCYGDEMANNHSVLNACNGESSEANSSHHEYKKKKKSKKHVSDGNMEKQELNDPSDTQNRNTIASRTKKHENQKDSIEEVVGDASSVAWMEMTKTVYEGGQAIHLNKVRVSACESVNAMRPEQMQSPNLSHMSQKNEIDNDYSFLLPSSENFNSSTVLNPSAVNYNPGDSSQSQNLTLHLSSNHEDSSQSQNLTLHLSSNHEDSSQSQTMSGKTDSGSTFSNFECSQYVYLTTDSENESSSIAGTHDNMGPVKREGLTTGSQEQDCPTDSRRADQKVDSESVLGVPSTLATDHDGSESLFDDDNNLIKNSQEGSGQTSSLPCSQVENVNDPDECQTDDDVEDGPDERSSSKSVRTTVWRGGSTTVPLEMSSRIYSICTNKKPDQQIKELESSGIFVRIGVWATEETVLLQKNFQEFMNEHGIKYQDGLLFPRLSNNPNEMRRFIKDKEFLRHLSKNLNRRPQACLDKAKRIFGSMSRKGAFTEEDMQLLKRLHSEYGNDFVKIGDLMERTGEAIKDKLKSFTQYDEFETKTPTPWTKEEDRKLISAIEKVLNIKDASKMDSKQKISWVQVAKFVSVRTAFQCRVRWDSKLSYTHCKKADIATWSAKEKARFVENIYLMEISEEQEIDWQLLSNIHEGKTVLGLKTIWYQLKSKVPNYKSRKFNEIRSCLYNSYFPHLPNDKSC